MLLSTELQKPLSSTIQIDNMSIVGKTAITALQRACLIVLTALTLSLLLIQKVK